MPVRKLFLSHSSRTVADKNRLMQVCAKLTGYGYHTLVDQSGAIPVGSDWDLHLSEWMAECHAAVILFSQDALHTDWVLKEAAILCWRARIDPTFVLVGILLDGVTPEQIDEKKLYRILRITDFQLQRNCSDVNDVVATVHNTLGGPQTADSTPFDDLEQRIGDIVAQVASPDALKNAWDRLPGPNKPATPSDFRFAPAFARYVLRDPKRALAQLYDLFESLVHLLDKGQATQLCTLVLGIWVEAEAASGLADASGKVVALNGSRVSKFSGRAYCERAWPHPRVYKLVPINAQNWSWSTIESDIQTPFADASDPFDDPKLNVSDYPGQVVILIASRTQSQAPAGDILVKLRANYPNAIILYWPGPEFPNDLPQLITPLQPKLDLKQEQDQFDMFNKINALITARAKG